MQTRENISIVFPPYYQLFPLNQGVDQQPGVKVKKTITTTGNFTPARFALLCLAIFCSLAFLLGRVAWLQIIKPDNLVKQEDMRSLREVAIDAPRG